MKRRNFQLSMAAGLATGLTACALPTASARARLQAEVDRTIAALMQEHRIAGMSVAIAAPGLREAFHYGVASRESGHPVTAQTLFEVGSISKVYTGLLGGWAAARGALAWSAPVSQHFAALRGSSFDQATMLDLATYTAGGLPLQMPDAVDDTDKMVAFYRGWRPAFAPGTHRLYSNASIGLFGHLAAQSLGLSFNDAMARTLYPALGLRDTFLQVPGERMADYAWGERDGRPVRVTPGWWDAQAYGVKTTAADLLRLVDAHMRPALLPPLLQQALALTQQAHYRVGPMHQGLGWELYRPGSTLDDLLAGNSTEMALQPQPVVRSTTLPGAPEPGTRVNKTGSTNGFGAYALFQPSAGAGVVLLANRNYPNAARVRAGHRLLAALTA